jgi:putative ABC transport system substrate-binding protein
VQAAARTLRRQIEVLTASTNREIDMAFASLVQKRADSLLVKPNTLFGSRRVQLVTLAARDRISAIYRGRESVDAGGLMTYGPNTSDQQREVGIYTGRILKGDKPADLPVMRATNSSLSSICKLQGCSASRCPRRTERSIATDRGGRHRVRCSL